MANIQFRPLHDRVVVRRVESENKTAGGIIIPDTAKENLKKVKLSLLVMELSMTMGSVCL